MFKIIISIILLSTSVGLILTGGLLTPIFYHNEELINLFSSLCGIGLGLTIFGYYIFISDIWLKKTNTDFSSIDFLKLSLVIILITSAFMAAISTIKILNP